ncbi:pyruvate formate lyase family protein [Pleomorphochaeta sp. DL1XJH-081]|uniref:pyruvate formate lyase family protein n=1 Tax=Pleomorphochaeta sp. DL1XJH-081 TaxID=3409690 RepID=UPI003BB636C8
MNEYIADLRKFFITDKTHHKLRQSGDPSSNFTLSIKNKDLSDTVRAYHRFKWMLENEKPIVFPKEKIAIIRTLKAVPEIFTENEWSDIKKSHRIHEQGKVCNINPNYMSLINMGTDAKRAEIVRSIGEHEKIGDIEGVKYLRILEKVLDTLDAFADRYKQEAERVGNGIVADSFSIIPRKKPQTFLQALQFFRLIHFGLWASFNYHNTIGRFDQYMYPYYEEDVKTGLLNEETSLELLQEFFISFNKDSDLYPGMQQGDNGQSIMLGGVDVDGNDVFNPLSKLCMQASLELKLIDPKINLRVHKKTPLSLYELGTQMTKQGLGFPQYSNDDVVIKALERWGYDHEDAVNYVVAACWEFIIPNVAMDIVNIDALSFLHSVTESLPSLFSCDTFEDFLEQVRIKLFAQASQICANTNGIYMEPAPLMSILMDGCIERAKDIRDGSKYNNYGVHGTGLSSAADSLAAIKKYVFEDKKIDKADLLHALDADFKGYEKMLSMLRYESPKMGNDDDYVDSLASILLDWFADAMEGHRNDRGGIFRSGTGSAMYYLWHGSELGATPDGRRKGEEFACNFSPSLFARTKGPISLIKSFSKAHLDRVANGGPLTIELHDTMFRNADSIQKVAGLVKTYMEIGGIQMQLNGVNRETMLEAQKHPEKYRNLIVRVWGWSGYFVELDKAYQDHIIKRMELDM